MVGLDFVVRAYLEAQSDLKRNSILQKIFELFTPITIKFCNRYRHIEESEVITQHVHIGISLALRKLDFGSENAGAIIYRHIQRELHQFIVLPFYRDKNRDGEKVPLENVEYKLTTKKVISEDDIITKLDIENAIKKLPEDKRLLVRLWLSGYNLHEIQNDVVGADVISSNRKSVYYHFSNTKSMLRENLVGYACA